MNDIKFNYLYRDGSNYKNFGSVVLRNFTNIDIAKIEYYIRCNLIDGEYFNAKKWNIPELFFEIPNSDDHEFHEFESIELTSNNKYHLSVEEFISKIIKT